MGLAQGSVAKISIRVALLAAVFSVFAATVRSSTQDVAAANGLQVDASYVYRLDTEANLTVWIDHTFKVTSLRFLTMDQGRKAITALMKLAALKKRRGYEALHSCD